VVLQKSPCGKSVLPLDGMGSSQKCLSLHWSFALFVIAALYFFVVLLLFPFSSEYNVRTHNSFRFEQHWVVTGLLVIWPFCNVVCVCFGSSWWYLDDVWMMSKWCLNDVYLMFESWFMHDDWCRCCCDCDNFVVVVNWCASAKMMFLLFLCCLNNVLVMSEWCLHEVWIMIGLCRNDVWSMFGWRLAVILMLLSFLCCCFLF
jgi:hypothetical protein